MQNSDLLQTIVGALLVFYGGRTYKDGPFLGGFPSWALFVGGMLVLP